MGILVINLTKLGRVVLVISIKLVNRCKGN